MGLRPDEEIAMCIQANVGSHMSKKMAAAGVIGASCESTVVLRRIKADICAADSGHYVGTDKFIETRAVYSIEIIENGAKWNEKTEAGIVAVHAVAPGNFSIKSQVFLHKDIGAKASIESATDGLWVVTGISA